MQLNFLLSGFSADSPVFSENSWLMVTFVRDVISEIISLEVLRSSICTDCHTSPWSCHLYSDAWQLACIYDGCNVPGSCDHLLPCFDKQSQWGCQIHLTTMPLI
uniref:Uncharacterized protein n=1 Tax=Pseudonaja textilis TaxID=8673 RepID=A0A670Y4X3_PSETE